MFPYTYHSVFSHFFCHCLFCFFFCHFNFSRWLKTLQCTNPLESSRETRAKCKKEKIKAKNRDFLKGSDWKVLSRSVALKHQYNWSSCVFLNSELTQIQCHLDIYIYINHNESVNCGSTLLDVIYACLFSSLRFAAVGNGGDFGYSVLSCTPCFSEMTKGSAGVCNSDVKINSSPEMWPPSQEAEQSSSSSLPRSESFFPLQTRLQRSQHLSTTSDSFLPNPRTGGQKVELGDSPKPIPRTRSSAAQQDTSSELLPTSSPSLPKNKLNQTLAGFEDHISTVSLSPDGIPSVRSSQYHSPAFLISKQSPKPPDSLSPRSRSISSPVNPIQSRPAHSTPVSEPKLAQLSPEHAITSPSTALPSLKLSLRESSESGLVSDRSIPTTPIYDSIRSSTPRVKPSHTEDHRSPPASKWLKGSRRSPKSLMLSLQLSMSG